MSGTHVNMQAEKTYGDNAPGHEFTREIWWLARRSFVRK